MKSHKRDNEMIGNSIKSTTVDWLCRLSRQTRRFCFVNVYLSLLISLSSISAYGVSFDCTKASSNVEKMICSDDELSELDSNLAVLYKKALNESKNSQDFKAKQKQWLSLKRNHCGDIACIKAAYKQRIDELTSTNKLPAEPGSNDSDEYDPEKLKEHERWLKQRDIEALTYGIQLGGPHDYVYVRDPDPTWDRGQMAYHETQDLQVCDLYMQNLNYFVEQKLPLSCGQPVAPSLKDKIQPVEWENIDPEHYPELFKAVVRHYFSNVPGILKQISDEEISHRSNEVKKGIAVFRRINLAFTGFPEYWYDPDQHLTVPVPIERPFQIVQYGFNVLDTSNPEYPYRCNPVQGRNMRFSTQRDLKIFAADEELHSVYGGIGDGFSEPMALWLINGSLYSESFDEYSDVHLSQFKFRPSLDLEPICLYHLQLKQEQEGN